jgi:hypothetical protein
MPSIDRNFLTLLRDDHSKFNVFVETGTYHGDTILAMEPYFNTLYTIEISQALYYNTKSKYRGNKINFLLGDSSFVLEDITKNISEPAIFFLDGHWSLGDTGRGPKDCPLYEELHHINNNFKNEAIIIIDDFRLFETSPTDGRQIIDWQNIRKDETLDILKSRITDVYHLPSNLSPTDRLVIHIQKIFK